MRIRKRLLIKVASWAIATRFEAKTYDSNSLDMAYINFMMKANANGLLTFRVLKALPYTFVREVLFDIKEFYGKERD